MQTLKFYDLKRKKSFMSNKYKFTSKKTKGGMRYFVIATSPSGVPSYRIVNKEFYKKHK
jgi:hypothetical protein